MCLPVRLQVDINVSPRINAYRLILMCLPVRLQVDINVSPRINVSVRLQVDINVSLRTLTG